jgi:hypothetical protein
MHAKFPVYHEKFPANSHISGKFRLHHSGDEASWWKKAGIANRRNARNSTGPITEEGKQRSRCNAVRHGLTAETVIGALEDAQDYHGVRSRPSLPTMMLSPPSSVNWCCG